MKLRTLIIDDEPLARLRMRKLLEVFPDDIAVLGEAGSGEEAVEKIQSLEPDLIFLDIQMPGMDGFGVLSSLDEDDIPMVVFTTAYDDYALRAFDEYAVDYLLKPIEDDRLKMTVEKLRRFFSSVPPVKMPLESAESYLQRIQVKIGNRTLLVPVSEIIRFQSEDKYTTIYTENSKHIIDLSLVDLEARLSPKKFVRVHRAHLVAIDMIAEYQKNIGGRISVLLKDRAKTMISVSRNFVARVRSL
ncbi:MAG: response regulator [Fibrobacter sp.]|nr:response regulator [Fibrobacter sp.]